MNQASRDELLLIPCLDGSQIDALLGARSHGPLTSLGAFGLSDESLARLSLEGPSTLRRIRALPLQTFVNPGASASR